MTRVRYVVRAVALLAATALQAQSKNDWPVYGGDAAGTKYSDLDSINRTNVSKLALAWRWETGELPLADKKTRPGAFEVTPVVVNDTMWLSTPYNRVVALDAHTGRELWSYDPRAYDAGQVPNGTGFVHRGIALWSNGRERRVFINSRWRLIALDAATGKRIPTFGDSGEIDLTRALRWKINRLHYTNTSPPVVFENLVIVGNGVADRLVYKNDPPGDVQAFDVRTGKRVWSWSPIPRAGEVGVETWENDSWKTTGHTNVWAPFSVDEQRGLVYLPVSTPSNDHFGGGRLGNNLFAESLVCLNARTGKRVWHYQIVHHGLWDYDLPAAPTLVTFSSEARRYELVAQVTKMGFVFVFDRRTGKPFWKIQERAVPASDVPGERASRTQPFPTTPAPFARQGLTESDLIDFTPELHAEALAVFNAHRHGPLFTPPSLGGTIMSPGNIGGAAWGGAAFDPISKTLYVKATNSPSLITVATPDGDSIYGKYVRSGPLDLTVGNGIPIAKPPYGTLTAIDMLSGKHRWQVTLGDTPRVRDNPALAGLTLPPLGVAGAPGPVVTAGGLIFITGGGSTLYAIGTGDGRTLWQSDLGRAGYANPMTYATSDGRQFVAIATGSGVGAALMVFALGR